MCSIGTKILITPEICTRVVFTRNDSLCSPVPLQRAGGSVVFTRTRNPAKVFLWQMHPQQNVMHAFDAPRSHLDENRFETARSQLLQVHLLCLHQTKPSQQRRHHLRDERNEMKCCSCFVKYSFGVWATVWSGD